MKTNAVRVSRETSVLWDDGSGQKDEGDEKRLSVAARLPESLVKHLVSLHGEAHGAKTRALSDCIRLHKKLLERLASERVRIQRFALDVGLSPTQTPEILVRLILKGLDEHERRSK